MSRSAENSPDVHLASGFFGPRAAAGPFQEVSDEGKSRDDLLGELAELRLAQQAILHKNRELDALNEIAQTVSRSLDLDEILNSALDKTLEILDLGYGAIYLLDPDGKRLWLKTIRAVNVDVVEKVKVIEIDEEAMARLVESGEPTFYSALGERPDLRRDIALDAMIREQINSAVLVALQAKGKTFGTLAAITQGDRVFTEEERGLLVTIAHVVSIAVENSLLYEDLSDREKARGAALRQAILAREEERRKIARELHDHTSQVLTGASAKIEAAMASLPPATDEIRARLTETRQSLTNLIVDLRGIIHELRPPMLDDLGLVAALQWHAEEYLDKAGIETHFEVVGKRKKLPPQTETALFRIVQEASTNIVRHARADEAHIRLKFERDTVTIDIRDNGRGFDIARTTNPKRRNRGMGLVSLTSRRGSGTEVSVRVPAK